jgi:transcriptional regulator with XRE-family HTH domain
MEHEDAVPGDTHGTGAGADDTTDDDVDEARDETLDDLVDIATLPHSPRTVVPPRRSGNRHGVNEAQRWTEFGRFVTERRDELGLNRRAAAKKAKLPETTLRALESGYQTAYGGVRVLPNLTADELGRLADALEMGTAELRTRLGRPAPRLISGNEQPDSRSTSLARRIARLDDTDRQLLELLVERLSQRE